MRGMSHQFLTSCGVLAVVIAVVSPGPVPVAGQAREPVAPTPRAMHPAPRTAAPRTAKPWMTARTPDGQPDLQGMWTNATITPFERPRGLAGKAYLTKEEAAVLEQQAAERRVIATSRTSTRSSR